MDFRWNLELGLSGLDDDLNPKEEGRYPHRCLISGLSNWWMEGPLIGWGKLEENVNRR